MTDEQRKRVHDITYSTDDREELAERIVKLEDENAKMREKYYKYESKMDGLVCELTGGLLSKSATLPNDALYSVIEEQMTDELVDESFKLTLENAKLRELARDALMLTKDTDCYGCRYDDHADCEHGYECTLLRRANELGIKRES